MITDGFTYLAFLIFFTGILAVIERQHRGKFFRYVPAIVLIYFLCIVFSTLGLWQVTAEIKVTYLAVKNALLPAMVFLMLLRCDVRKVARLGPRMLLAFFTASISIGAGFIVTFAMFKNQYDPGTWAAFAALCGSWMGGTGNMVAIQGALGVPDAQLGYALLMDSINYAVWVMFLLAVVPFAHTFNSWVGANPAIIDKICKELSGDQEIVPKQTEFPDLLILLGTALLISALSHTTSRYMPQTTFLTATSWTIIIATLAGIFGAFTNLQKLPGSNHLSHAMLYLLVALIASGANLSQLAKAPLYIISGFIILGIHALIMLVAARIFKFDLFTCGIASLANIGGVASAPILAAAYSEALIPIGVLMAMMGYVVGTGGGLVIGKILSIM